MVNDPIIVTKSAGPAAGMTKLHQRFLSALAMITAAIGCAWAGGAVFAALVLAVGCVMLWEWTRMVGVSDAERMQFTVVGVGSLLIAASSVFTGLLASSVATIPLGLIAVWLFRPRLLGIGILYVTVPLMLLIWLRGDETAGFIAIAFLFSIVWATDTFAMVTGKLVGGPPLWPSVSPNKTWAGAVGGLLGGATLGSAIAVFAVAPDHWLFGLVAGCLL
ncbi:MAG: phosphatidate cytidylyltransferase, partial [Pseudomonadota bacterium]